MRRVAAEAFTTGDDVRNSECPCVADLNDTELDVLIDAASDALAIASLGVISGRKTVTVLPYWAGQCNLFGTGEGWGWNWPQPYDGVPLPGIDPVIQSVKIDGVTVDPTTYTIHRRRDIPELFRLGDGTSTPSSWPTSQALWRNGVGANTFTITYTFGLHIDWMVEEAAIELVCDFAVPTLERKKSTLPPGVSSLSQGGATVSIDKMAERIRRGEAGPATSRAVNYYAPHGQMATQVWSPELMGGWELHVLDSAQAS